MSYGGFYITFQFQKENLWQPKNIFPVMSEDIFIADKVFGKDIYSGKARQYNTQYIYKISSNTCTEGRTPG